MFALKQFLTFAYDYEYESAYDLPLKPNYSNPKIYSAKGDLSKRWYVYFSFKNPETGKLKRLTPFYGEANKYKTKEERMEVLVVYRKVLLKLLKQGYNPFGDNTVLHHKLHEKKTIENPREHNALNADSQVSTSKIPEKTQQKPQQKTLQDAFSFALKLKEKQVGERTIKDYQYKVKGFLKWIEQKHPDIITIDELNKKLLLEFLNELLISTSARNRNNYRVDLSSVMQVLEDNDIIDSNFIRKIPIIKSKPQRNKTYSIQSLETIFKHLEQKDPHLLLFIKFVSYNFLRPLEVCRLKVKDINIKNRTLQFQAKNSPLKTKIIPEILWKELPDLSKLDKEDFLFTPQGYGGVWETNENNKRNYFTKRFKKVVKEPFNLDKDYTVYSFRHTFITKLYRALLEGSSPFEAKSKLMLITGHSSMKSLESYLRDIDAELPADYSNLLTTTNG